VKLELERGVRGVRDRDRDHDHDQDHDHDHDELHVAA
jgi:hypothetical protein